MINLQKLLTYEEFCRLQECVEATSKIELNNLIKSFEDISLYQDQILKVFPTEESIENYPVDIIKIGLVEINDDIDLDKLSEMSFEELSLDYDKSISFTKKELIELRRKAIEYKNATTEFEEKISIFKGINRKLKPVKDYYNEESWKKNEQ